MPTVPPCTASLILLLLLIGLVLLVMKLTPNVPPKQIPYGDEWIDYENSHASKPAVDPNDTDECYWDTEAIEIALDRWNNPERGD